MSLLMADVMEPTTTIMGGDVQINSSRREYRKSTRKVKSGCRTCKIRKVKCDEGRPACRRCVSTGRVCDGYGVWGGGGNSDGHPQPPILDPKLCTVAPKLSAAISILAASTEERQYFEWFKCRTAKKIPGAFFSTFWDKLVFQASIDEPAVLNAVFTLSSVHKGNIVDVISRSRRDCTLGNQEQFMLQHYSKAIHHLQPHFSTKDKSSIRVALITCVLFVCVELLRGHFRISQTHLQNGLKILKESLGPSSMEEDELLVLKPSRELIDDWIAEALCRLHLQVVLWEQGYQQTSVIIQDLYSNEPTLPIYHSFYQAWKQLERLLNKTLLLTKQFRRQRVSEYPSVGDLSKLLEQRQHVQAELMQWLKVYEASAQNLQREDSEGRGYQLLHVCHRMTNIMASVCLYPDDESVFDRHTDQFMSLISRAISLSGMRSIGLKVQVTPGDSFDASRSIVDIGWIPALYYTALKCRIHRVRLQAIRLIESTGHREGMWDSKIASYVARKVMEMEERDFYKNIDTADDFSLSSSPISRDLSLPTLPKSYRMDEVEVVLPDGPLDSVLLFCKQKQSNENFKVFSKEYNVISQCWTDLTTGTEEK